MMDTSRLLCSGLIGLGIALCATAASAQSVTISAPFDVSTEFGPAAVGTVGDFTPVVIPGPSGAAFLGFIRIAGATHVTGVHSIIVRSVTSSSDTTGTTLVGRTSDLNLPFATSLALTSEGSTPIAVYGLTDNTVAARPIMGFPSPAAFQLVPLMSAMVPSGDSITDVSVPVFAARLDVGITTRTGSSVGHLFSAGIMGSPGSLVLTGSQTPVAAVLPRAIIRAAGPGGSLPSLFVDYNPGASRGLFVHQADGSPLAMAPTISTARPGFTALTSGDFLVVLNPEVAAPSGPTQLQCKILTISGTPTLDGSGEPCPLAPSPPTDIAAATDPSDPNGAWIGGAFGDGNPTVFIALNGSSAAPAIGMAGPSFAGCAHPSVSAIDSTHAVITALCGIPSMPPHVLIWIATKPPVPVDGGVADAASDAISVPDGANVTDVVSDSGSSDAGSDVAMTPDANGMTDSASPADTSGVSFRGSGCNCRTAPGSRGGVGFAAFGVLATLASRRRRRARA